MWIYNIYLSLILFTKPILKPNIAKINYNNTWTTFDIRPDDAELSCYLKNDIWYCISDKFLTENLDPEDSY